MAVSWRDALKQAAAPPAASAKPVPVDPGAVSPTLRRLLDERRRMEEAMADLTGRGGAADPRFAVASLAQRRAELAQWAAARDAARPGPKPSEPERARAAGEPDPMPTDRSAAGRGMPERAAAERADERLPAERPLLDRLLPDRSVAGRMLAAFAVPDAPPLRATPGEGGTRAAPRADPFGALREQGPKRSDASGFTERAFDRIAQRAVKVPKAEEGLARAKKAIPDDWRERARRMTPTLDDSAYARRAKKLLSVEVGSLTEIGERAEKLRDTVRDVRELKAADEAGDDKRRDRALERLKAKRQEDA